MGSETVNDQLIQHGEYSHKYRPQFFYTFAIVHHNFFDASNVGSETVDHQFV